MNTPRDRTPPENTGATRSGDLHHDERDDIHLDDRRHTEGVADHRTDRTVERPVTEERHVTHERPVAEERHVTHERPVATEAVVDRARGGASFWSILSGILVAFGAFLVLAVIIGAILAAIGANEGGLQTNNAAEAGIAVAVGLVIAQFLAYLWGGYTAGRMARGSGVLNGILVPIIALLIVALLGVIAAATMGTSADAAAAEANAQAQALPLPLSDLGQLATGTGIGLLIAMLLGGALGGAMGARWHTKLEDREAHDLHAGRDARYTR